MRTVSANGIRLVKKFEGLRTTAYIDADGNLTIGYGHVVQRGDPRVISKAEAEEILARDLEHYAAEVDKDVHVNLTQNQFDALVIFTLNVGVNAFRNSTLLKMLNKGFYNAVPTELMRWVHGKRGNVITGLVNRRKAEIALWQAP